jgi:hypothetical protein
MRVENKTYSNTLSNVKVKIGKSTIIIYDEDETIRIPRPDGIPEYLCLPMANQLESCTVRTNGGGDMLYSLYPTGGTHIVRFKRFVAKPGELPMPRMVEGKDVKLRDGRSYYKPEHLQFTVLLEILNGDWEGAEMPLFLEYNFGRDKDGTAYLNGSKGQNKKVYDFLELAGFDVVQESLAYSDNVLPYLEQILSERDEPFMVTMENGYIKTLAEVPAGMFKKAVKGATKKAKPVEEEEFENPFEVPAEVKKPKQDEEEWEDDEDEVEPEPAPKAKRKAWRED